MRKYIITILTSLLMVVTSQAALTTITWADNHSDRAGEFILTQPEVPSFHTFCVELGQYINVGNTYSYQIANASDGGVNGPTPVTLGTAWLYSSFRNGNLSGYVSTYDQQTQLQNTFWYLQGETTDASGVGNWLNLAQLALPGKNLFADANGAYGVNVWNLYDANGVECQSQLGITAVPEPTTALAGAMALLFLPWALLSTRSKVIRIPYNNK